MLLLGAAPMQKRVGRDSSVKRHEVSNGSAGTVGTAAFGGEEEHRLDKKGRSLEREPRKCRDGGCRRRGTAPPSGKREEASSGSVVLAGVGTKSEESWAPVQ
eukprot:9488775-Pyramimonas_sp.AAC.1